MISNKNLIFILAFFLPYTLIHADTIDHVAAVVNREPLTLSMVEDNMNAFWIDSPPQSLDASLQRLIGRRLQIQEARKRGISYTEEELADRMAIVISRFASPLMFAEALKNKGITQSDLQSYLIEEIIAQKMVDRAFGIFIKNSDIEGDAVFFFEQNKEKFVTPEILQLRRIHFRYDHKDDERHKVEKALEELRLEGNISAYPDMEDTTEYMKPEQLSPIESATASQMRVGDISPILELSTGYLIIVLLDRIPSRKATFNEKKAEIEAVLRQQKIDEELKLWLKKEKEKADIRINITSKLSFNFFAQEMQKPWLKKESLSKEN